MKDQRFKELMDRMGMPESRSLLETLKQVEQEVSLETENSLRKEFIKMCLDDGRSKLAIRVNKGWWSDPQPTMLYDPITGKDADWPLGPRGFRNHYKSDAWLFNPYTGKPRKPSEIGYDPFGLLIEP